MDGMGWVNLIRSQKLKTHVALPFRVRCLGLNMHIKKILNTVVIYKQC